MVYELRIYSMEAGSFGEVVRSRQVKAPQCITSIQFSPTSQHLLVAYGRYAAPSPPLLSPLALLWTPKSEPYPSLGFREAWDMS